MKLVVDANVLFSALIKEGKTIEIFLNPFLNLHTPKFVLEEFEKHKEEILNKTKRTGQEFESTFDRIKEIVRIINEEEFFGCLDEAETISPDPDDVLYFALALNLRCPIWSNDKKLKEQSQVKIYSTEDLAKEFEV